MENETFYQDVLTGEKRIFLGHLILTGFAQSWKVFEVWVESLKSRWAPFILEKLLKSLISQWKVLGRIFNYNCRSIITEFLLIVHLLHSACLKLKINPGCPHFQVLEIQTCKFGSSLWSVVACKNNLYPLMCLPELAVTPCETSTSNLFVFS